MPLHPLVVHFPIALLLVATVIEIVNLFLKKDYLSKTGTVLFVLGVISGFVTLATGDGAEEFAYDNWGKVFLIRLNCTPYLQCIRYSLCDCSSS